jgi:hypothetical protein
VTSCASGIATGAVSGASKGELVEYICCPIFRIQASGLPIDVSPQR